MVYMAPSLQCPKGHAVAITGVYECLVCKLCFRGGFNVDAIDKLPAVVKSEMFQV